MGTVLPASATIPSLDGVRAIAVLIVLCAHAGLGAVVPGGLGVTVFFVLSGFLISTLMRQEQARTGSIDFRAFYLRRALRLLPPLLIIVAAAAVVAAFSSIDDGFSREGLLAVLFYYGNYYLIAADFHGVPGGLGVVWSLAVEEQYYLLYPPLALLLLRTCPPLRTAAWLATICGAVLAWRVWLALHGASEAYLTMATDTRIDSILAGCVLAFAANPWLDPPAPDRRRDLALALACVALLVLSMLWRDPLFRNTLRYTLQNLAIAGLLWLAVARARSAALRWLNAPVAVYIGTVSYTLYLSHHVIAQALTERWPDLAWYVLLPSTLLLSLAVAEPIRRWVEAPCARWRRRLHQPRRTAVRRASAPLAKVSE